MKHPYLKAVDKAIDSAVQPRARLVFVGDNTRLIPEGTPLTAAGYIEAALGAANWKVVPGTYATGGQARPHNGD